MEQQHPMVRMTAQRKAILDAFDHAQRPLAPGEIHTMAERDVPQLGLSTVYRTVRMLADAGMLAAVEIPGEPPRYELNAVAAHHHHHFHCRTCDRVFDVDACPPGLEQLVPKGFVMTDHTIVLHGRCAECA
jgi:Fur family ferric uptake transcriptional regulator